MKTFFVSSLCGACLLFGAACSGPRHLSRDYGKATAQAFKTQAVRAPGSAAQPSPGLDAQESAVIASGLRQSLARQGAKAADAPILYVAPPTGSNGGGGTGGTR